MSQISDLTKTLVPTEKGILDFDTLVIDGQRWIVPEWIDGYPTEGFSRPARMIRVDLLLGGRMGDRWYLQNPIPISVLDGETTQGFDVVELPNHFVEFGEPGKAH